MHKTFGEVPSLPLRRPQASMIPDDFFCALFTEWQMDNARIVLEWQRMCRMRTYHVREQ